MRKKCLIVVFFLLISQSIYPKDIELILYKDFLQKLVNKIFPINLSGSYSSGYKIDINNPVLSIQPKHIQLDSTVSLISVFGNQTFPTRCKLIPIYNPVNNNIELKVIEGKVDLAAFNLGIIELAQYISNIKIPLEINNFDVKDKTIRPKCRNVTFQLLKDRLIVNSEVLIE